MKEIDLDNDQGGVERGGTAAARLMQLLQLPQKRVAPGWSGWSDCEDIHSPDPPDAPAINMRSSPNGSSRDWQ